MLYDCTLIEKKNEKKKKNLSGSSYIPCLLLIIKLRYTCGEMKIWYQIVSIKSIKKSQNIMSMIVKTLLIRWEKLHQE